MRSQIDWELGELMSNPSVIDVTAITDPGDVGREKHSKIDRFVVQVSNIVAWAFPLLMVCIVAQVFLRGAGLNQAWLDDLQWWIYGFAMMTGLCYAITTNSHVRVDILHQHFSDTKKARIEAFALGWMMLPFFLYMTDILTHYAISSVQSGEGSDSPNGLHGLYLLKSSLPLLFILATLAAWAALRRNLTEFTDLSVRSKLIWAFPAAVFLLWRLAHYIVYWIVRLANPEIKPRRIPKEPIFEYLLIGAFWAVIIALVVAFVLRGRGKSGEQA